MVSRTGRRDVDIRIAVERQHGLCTGVMVFIGVDHERTAIDLRDGKADGGARGVNGRHIAVKFNRIRADVWACGMEHIGKCAV